jgi:hypothetical protein
MEDEKDVVDLKGVTKRGDGTERGESATETDPETVGDLIKKRRKKKKKEDFF